MTSGARFCSPGSYAGLPFRIELCGAVAPLEAYGQRHIGTGISFSV